MARLTLKLLKLAPPFTIAIDRTEWQLGKSFGQRLDAFDQLRTGCDPAVLDGNCRKRLLL